MNDHLLPEPPPEDHEPLDLMAVGADDRLLDDLGQDLPTDPDHDDPAEDLLAAWRSSLLPCDLPAPPPAPLLTPAPRRRAMPMFAAAAAIVALLLGTAAIGSRAAGPDDMLWPLTKLLWPDRIESVAAAENAVAALDLARTALGDGEPPQASIVLTAAAQDISKVQPRDGRADLDADYQQLWTELEESMALDSFPTSAVQTPPSQRPSGSRPPISSGATGSPTTTVPSGSGSPGWTSGSRPPTTGGSTTAPVPPPPPTPQPTTSATPPTSSTSDSTDPSPTTTTTPTPPPVTSTTPESPTESSSTSTEPDVLSPDAPDEQSPAELPLQQRFLDTGSVAEVPAQAGADAGAN